MNRIEIHVHDCTVNIWTVPALGLHECVSIKPRHTLSHACGVIVDTLSPHCEHIEHIEHHENHHSPKSGGVCVFQKKASRFL